MGYYVTLTDSDAFLPKKHYDKAYKRLCDLNKQDHLKHGGSFSGGKKQQVWFSWMSPNYDKECKDVREILEQVGFDINETDKGLYLVGYDNKTGQEDLFLKAICNLMQGRMEWRGEDGRVWAWELGEEKIKTYSGYIRWMEDE